MPTSSMSKPIGFRQQVNNFLGINLFSVPPQKLPTDGYEPTPAGSIYAPVTVAQPAVYNDPRTADYVKLGFSENGSVFTIVSKVASKFGSIPRYAYKIEDKKATRELKALVRQKGFKLVEFKALHKKAYDEQEVESPYSELLQQPNPMQGQDEFYELACVFYMVTRNCFIWLNRGNIVGMTDIEADRLPPLEMFVLPTQHIQIVPDEKDVFGVKYYVFDVGGVKWRIRKQDMIHWKGPNPNFDATTRVHMFGLSPLRPGNKWLSEDEAGTDSTVSAYQNDGAKGVLYQTANPNPSPEAKAEVDRVVNRKINNRSLRGAVAALQGSWGYANLAQTGQEMERMDGRDKAFVRLCNLFGVSPMLFLTNTTFSNVEQAEKSLVTNLVAPYACSLRDAMNGKLLPAFGLSKQNYTHDIDISQLPELQTEMKDLATTLNICWWWTPNQRLKAQNMDESADPNMNKVWMPTTLTLMDDAALANQIDSYNGDNPMDPGGDNPNDAGQNISDPSKGDTGKGN